MDYDFLKASDGSGDAALMHITANRSTGSTTIVVDTVTNVPPKFIATSGTPLPSGLLDPTTLTNFKGHITAGNLEIDSFEAGSIDNGNLAGQVVIIKPNTGWSNRVAQFLMNYSGLGTPQNATIAALTAISATLSGALTAASAAIAGALTIGGNLTISGQAHVVSASITSAATITPSSQIFNVTAQAVGATIAVPSFGAVDGMSQITRIMDNGTSQALAFASGYSNVSGLATPTATVAGKLLTIGSIYNSATSKWEIQGINQSA